MGGGARRGPSGPRCHLASPQLLRHEDRNRPAPWCPAHSEVTQSTSGLPHAPAGPRVGCPGRARGRLRAPGSPVHRFVVPGRGIHVAVALRHAVAGRLRGLPLRPDGAHGVRLPAFVFLPAPHHLHPGAPVHWFLMQIGMVAGFLTSWPGDTRLIRLGVKEAR
ncbi:DUF4396 domain-containing protein [Streptomyces sp. NRRL F-5126]|uniref:DUF4396 domain-containing protein n=1 Tax=Streptomyces sp. NRRL F-5126 TaxID=1463857 RepID=UPI003B633DAF